MAVTSLVKPSMVTTDYLNSSAYIDWVTKRYGSSPSNIMIMYSAIAVLALLGVVGNVVSIVIWTRPQMKSSSSALLAAMAVCDSLLLMSQNTSNYLFVLWLRYHESHAIVIMHNFVYPHVRLWFNPMYLTAQTASIYLTVAITLDRYIAVCRPFEAKLVSTYSRSCTYAVTIITVSILYNLPEFLKFKVEANLDDKGDITFYVRKDTELSQSPMFESIYELYRDWLHLILVFLLPWICIAVLNKLIYLEMRRMKRQIQAISNSQRKENRLSMMLVYVVAELLVCSFCYIFLTITTAILKIGDYKWVESSLSPLRCFFDTVNSSSNVLTYVIFMRGFREAFINIFSCCRRRCRLRRPNTTGNRELDVRNHEGLIYRPTGGKPTEDLQMDVVELH